jgi:hypothetical protein
VDCRRWAQNSPFREWAQKVPIHKPGLQMLIFIVALPQNLSTLKRCSSSCILSRPLSSRSAEKRLTDHLHNAKFNYRTCSRCEARGRCPSTASTSASEPEPESESEYAMPSVSRIRRLERPNRAGCNVSPDPFVSTNCVSKCVTPNVRFAQSPAKHSVSEILPSTIASQWPSITLNGKRRK